MAFIRPPHAFHSKAHAALVAAALSFSCGVWAADTPMMNTAPEEVPSPRSAVESRLSQARAAIAAQRWAEAIRLLHEAEARAPQNADVHNLLGYSLRKQTPPDVPAALRHYRRALELDPAHKGAHEYIGEAYLMLNQPDQAQVHLQALERLCGGRNCEEYRDLAKALQRHRSGRP